MKYFGFPLKTHKKNIRAKIRNDRERSGRLQLTPSTLEEFY